VVFTIALPKYSTIGDPWSYFVAYNMTPFSAFSDEEEVLLVPYTRFTVTKAPKQDGEGVWRVGLDARCDVLF